MNQSAEDITIAVGGNWLEGLNWSYSGTTASFPLYKFKLDYESGSLIDGRWTGSGTYNVFVRLESDIGRYIYLKESVNFSSATTSIQINSGNLVSYESRD